MQSEEKKSLQISQTQMPHLQSDLPALPPILREMASLATSDSERDMLLAGTLTAVSACLPNVCGLYDRHTVYPHMYLFVSAPASAGKGCLNFCRDLVKPIHLLLEAQAEAAAEDSGKAQPANRGGLLIQANSSATAFIQALSNYGGNGLMFETEGDTVAQAIKLDNYSDLLRKAFHHEDFGYIRRRNSENVYIRNPRLAILLSGTPAQIGGLIPTAENGLFSRFLYLTLNHSLDWKDVFSEGDDNVAEQLIRIQGRRLLRLYSTLDDLVHPLRFRLTPAQRSRFNRTFTQLQETYAPLYGVDLIPTIRRLGLFSYRIAMVLSALRLADGGVGEEPTLTTPASLPGGNTTLPGGDTTLPCSDPDLALALHITTTLVDHAARVYSELPRSLQERMEERVEGRPLSGAQALFYDALPDHFETADAIRAAIALKISRRSCFNYLKRYLVRNLLTSPRYGRYEKPSRPRQAE